MGATRGKEVVEALFWGEKQETLTCEEDVTLQAIKEIYDRTFLF